MGIRQWYHRGRPTIHPHTPLGAKPMLTYQVEVVEESTHTHASETWLINGQRHREGDLPAQTCNGDKYWYKLGKLHRTQGPAVEDTDGGREWWLDGKKCTKAGHAAALNQTTDMTIAEIEKKLGYKIKVIK